MQKLIMLSLTLSALASTSLMQSCRKTRCFNPNNPNCENYDPCLNEKPVSADFTFGSYWTGPRYNGTRDSVFNDTILRRSSVYFKSFLKNAKNYTWLLGSESIDESDFIRTFANVPYGEYKVTHIVEKIPNSKCYSLDNGKDTQTKYFYIKPFYQFPILGVYKVLWQGAKDSSYFSILPWEYRSQNGPLKTKQSENVQFIMCNADNTGTDTAKDVGYSSEPSATGSMIAFRDGRNPTYPIQGSLKLVNKDCIKADYWYHKKRQIFAGRRVQ